MSCFYEYTDTPVINDRVTAMADLLKRHPKAAYSSLLHAIVDDMNLDDWWFDLTDADNRYLRETYPAVSDWERHIFDDLAALTEAERATAVALFWGYDLNT